jgi:hypothetical protein
LREWLGASAACLGDSAGCHCFVSAPLGGWMAGWLDGWRAGWRAGWTDGWLGGGSGQVVCVAGKIRVMGVWGKRRVGVYCNAGRYRAARRAIDSYNTPGSGLAIGCAGGGYDVGI